MPFAPKQASQVAEPTEPKGRFLPGNNANPSGRPIGSRNKFATQYIDDFYTVWQEEGVEALRKAARKTPARYIAVAAALIPQHFKVEHEHTLAGLSVAELREKLVEARQRLIASGVELPVIDGEVVEVAK